MYFRSDVIGVDATFDTLAVTGALSLTNALSQNKSHASADTDANAAALHHTLGTGASQAAAGNDPRLSDARVPTDSSVTTAKIAVGGLAPSVITGTVIVGTDPRLSDARPPSNDASLMHLAGTEVVTGAKTFTTSATTAFTGKVAAPNHVSMTVAVAASPPASPAVNDMWVVPDVAGSNRPITTYTSKGGPVPVSTVSSGGTIIQGITIPAASYDRTLDITATGYLYMYSDGDTWELVTTTDFVVSQNVHGRFRLPGPVPLGGTTASGTLRTLLFQLANNSMDFSLWVRRVSGTGTATGSAIHEYTHINCVAFPS